MRILTAGDFDGLVSSALLLDAEEIEHVEVVEPRSIESGDVPVTKDDILVNLPYVDGCCAWFDRHVEKSVGDSLYTDVEGRREEAPSCARVVYNHYEKPEWKTKRLSVIEAAGKINSAKLSLKDVLSPEGWILLSDTVDPRARLEKSSEYFCRLARWVSEKPLEEILVLPEVRKKSREFFKRRSEYEETLKLYSHLDGPTVVTDFRSIGKAPIGNRFLVYAMYPTACVSISTFGDIYSPDNSVITVGSNIFNDSFDVDLSSLMENYDATGSRRFATIVVPSEETEDVVEGLVEKMKFVYGD